MRKPKGGGASRGDRACDRDRRAPTGAEAEAPSLRGRAQVDLSTNLRGVSSLTPLTM
jgi:hypothetical protein